MKPAPFDWHAPDSVAEALALKARHGEEARFLAGVPRHIFGTFEGYKRGLEMANSTHVGVCFCIGTWLEGGELMGADVVTAEADSLKIDYWDGDTSEALPTHVDT